ncbi:hypothetical protein B5C34_05580 [Pacificimonas flava]|uniref:GST N-terminal domain-containing protein n=2 Tax=Pacificimonas TaxID=1960290 RepID=A0A219B3M0_9SPHN|nr:MULTISPECIES: glutathione S-transferase family protein [Pacificimonas]MBZ6377308.1 glutathione S-transferase C-terminal domain-containing protein [Pacificimonas aurantium]OWV32982.1 hypothetical protein B5C34_05580 [Pacificimonas flava]
MSGGQPILWGTPASLYTAKARSYLRKQRIGFEERAPGEAHFQDAVVPALKRWIIPVLELPDGTLVQDGADIIDHFEAGRDTRLPAVPDQSVLTVLAHLLALFGGEALLRPAMHYRWNFDDENLSFLADDFSIALGASGSPEDRREAFSRSSSRMRKAAASFGVGPDTYALVEAAYLDFLARFERHLAEAPYLLGGRPTLADYAFAGPLCAHLGRDPYPARLMQRQAPGVWRWTERVAAPEDGAPGYAGSTPDLFQPGQIPDTLVSLLAFFADEFLPELAAHIDFANGWLAERPDLEAGTNGLDRPGERRLGKASFAWRGTELTTAVLPYRFWLLQRVQDAAAALGPAQRAQLDDLLGRVGLTDILALRTDRRVERRGNLEIWGPRRAS